MYRIKEILLFNGQCLLLLIPNTKVVNNVSTLSIDLPFYYIWCTFSMTFLLIVVIPLLTFYASLLSILRSTLFMDSNTRYETVLYVFSHRRDDTFQPRSGLPSCTVYPNLTSNNPRARCYTFNFSKLRTVSVLKLLIISLPISLPRLQVATGINHVRQVLNIIHESNIEKKLRCFGLPSRKNCHDISILVVCSTYNNNSVKTEYFFTFILHSTST